jgi:UDPglucose 6-dehydrogenase
MRVAVIGTGQVGLVTAATMASFGHDVAAVDAEAEKIDVLSRGEPPVFDSGLPELVDEQIAAVPTFVS